MEKLLLAGSGGESTAELAKLLKDQYEIITAADGSELVKAAGAQKPDLILLGQDLPAEGGLALCGSLKGQADTEDIPVILLMTAGAAAGSAAVFAAGARDYLPAGFSPAELFARVRLQLDLRQAGIAIREYERQLAEKNFHLRDLTQQIENMARIDILTNLPNRQYMLERMKDETARAFRNQRPLTLLVADIDDYQKLVARHGKECGEFVLQTMASVLRTGRRGQDVVARWDEDRFMLMLPETILSDGGRLAERIRASIEATKVGFRDKVVRVTMTLGVAEYSPEYGIEGTLNQVENAVQRGKQASKNCVVLSAG